MPRSWKVFLGLQMLWGAVRLVTLDNDRPWEPWLKAGAAFAMLSMFIWVLARLRIGHTFIGPDGVTTRGAVIRRHRAWPDLYDIRVEPSPVGRWNPDHFTLAYSMDGRRLPLFFVDSQQCDDLPAEVEAIRTDGAAWRDMPWTRLPAVEEKIRRRALRRASWNRAFICMACSYVPALFLILWRVFHDKDGHPVLFLVWGPLAVLLACLTLFVATESRRPTRTE